MKWWRQLRGRSWESMPAPNADTAPEVARLTAQVHGFVQMVGYRDFCKRTAFAISRDQPIKITGYSRNQPNGTTVEVVAEGPRALLERFLTALREGPGMAQVIDVEASWGAATREFDGFSARS